MGPSGPIFRVFGGGLVLGSFQQRGSIYQSTLRSKASSRLSTQKLQFAMLPPQICSPETRTPRKRTIGLQMPIPCQGIWAHALIDKPRKHFGTSFRRLSGTRSTPCSRTPRRTRLSDSAAATTHQPSAGRPADQTSWVALHEPILLGCSI